NKNLTFLVRLLQISHMDNMLDISDVEEFQYDQVDPEFEQESEAESLVDESIDEEEKIPETACFTSWFHVKTIIHFNIPVEYLSNSPEGVATIFHIADWANPNHIQYSMEGSEVHLVKKSLYFGNIQVYKEEYDYIRIKICQFIDLSLTSIEHNNVNVESSLWKKITENHNQDIDFKKTNTY
ncbi:13536_t:CDS:2, partial [Dentiscutata heterogama]